MSHLEDVEEALGTASAVLAAVQFCASHYGFGGFEFSFENLPPLTIYLALERALAVVKPVNQAIERRHRLRTDSSGQGVGGEKGSEGA